ncbi:unnamed protein product [Dicrocoelium dendriticum]|nr:unnamed protein product [Dicrocoelium dendriticum]
MPKYYCDYCDTYLTHDSPSVRKTHCGGRNHKDNVKEYYQKWLEEQVQKLVDHTSEAYKQGKVPPPMFGGPLGMPPPGLAYPPRYPIKGPDSDDSSSRCNDPTQNGCARCFCLASDHWDASIWRAAPITFSDTL